MEKQFCVQCGTSLIQEDKFCPKCGTPVRGAAVQSRNRAKVTQSRRWSISPRALVTMGIILLTLVGALIIYNADRSLYNLSTPPDSHDAQGIPYPEVPRISIAEAKTRYDARTALFVDVRSQGEYDAAHIPNAKLLSLADLQSRYRELPTNQEILLYCT